jgi:aspartate ammonia-lyase
MSAPSSTTRKERDLLGERDVPAAALWGIHTLRATENFPLSGRRVFPGLIHAYGLVKQACARTNRELGSLPAREAEAIEGAAAELAAGKLDEHILVDALQGGAGTSLNMNVNEVLTNRALAALGHAPGDYAVIDPLDHVNLHQSTNDTYPTALKVAAVASLRVLEKAVVELQEAFQVKERELADVVKVGRTELQDAVLTTLGREMGAYAEAFTRDRWRIYKCEERLRVVNLGGTAIGTGLGAPRAYIFRVVDVLRELSGFGLARAENLVEATQNADAFVEVSGILKACATSLWKICSDLRLLSSGPSAGLAEIRLPPRQAGSSIMPGKVNPVVPEAVTQAAMQVIANDLAITLAVSSGSLELNPFLPLVADTLLGSLDLLTASCRILARECVTGIVANVEQCHAHVHDGTAALTALVERLGHAASNDLSKAVAAGQGTLRELVVRRGLLSADEYDHLTSPGRVNQIGHRSKETE